MASESGSEFLEEKYHLSDSTEVQSAARRTNKRRELAAEDGEEFEAIPDDADAETKIANYLDRLTEITDREDPARHEHGLNAVKRLLHSKFVIKHDQIPDSYWEAQRRQAHEHGAGEIEITDEIRERDAERLIADQTESLDNWMDYLTSDDAHYPDYLKYFTIRSVVGMGNYDHDRHTFTPRTPHTVKRFPTLSRGALARTLDGIERYFGPEYFTAKEELTQANLRVKEAKNHLSFAQKQNQEDLSAEQEELTSARAEVAAINQKLEDLINGQIDENPDQPKFPKALMSADFASLYAIALEKSGSAKQELWPNTNGQWQEYSQGQDQELVESIAGYGTDWCLEGSATTQNYLDQGQLLIYYSENEQEEPKIPRAGVFVVDGQVREVHGVGPEQNLDPFIADTVRNKMHELGDTAYEKRAYDMQMVTHLERKTQANHQLDKDDLVFLYELNSKIEGFGYQKDPRIAELRSQRNPEEDMPIVFDCEPSQIAHSVAEINVDTKAYVGQLEPGIFNKLLSTSGFEHVYTSFPKGRIQRSELLASNSSLEAQKNDLAEQDLIDPDYTIDMLNKLDFATLDNHEDITLIILSVNDLGLPVGSSTYGIYDRAAELGLEICPPETGLKIVLQGDKQTFVGNNSVAMDPIIGRVGRPSLFHIRHRNENLMLDCAISEPSGGWPSDSRFVFRLPKASPEAEIPE